MSEEHSPAAVTLQTQGIKGIPFSVLSLKQGEVSFPLVSSHLPTRKTSNWNDHVVSNVDVPSFVILRFSTATQIGTQ